MKIFIQNVIALFLTSLSLSGQVLFRAQNETSAGPSSYSYKKTITISDTMVSGSSDLSGYVVTIPLTTTAGLNQSSLKSVANGGVVTDGTNGVDIVFSVTASDTNCATPAGWEKGYWDATTGDYVAYVGPFSTYSHTANTVIYLCAGNAAITTFQGGAASTVWANYKLVQHLSGATLSVADSSGNNTPVNHGATATTGPLGSGAAAFSSAYIDSGSVPTGGQTTVTVEALVNPGVTTRGDIVNRWIGGFLDGSQFDLLYGLTSGIPQFFISNSSGAIENSGAGSTAMSTGTWYQMAGVMDNTNIIIYLDGVSQSSLGAIGQALYSVTANYRIGDNSAADGAFTGSAAEVRVTLTPLSADYLLTDYRNLLTPGTYISVM